MQTQVTLTTNIRRRAISLTQVAASEEEAKELIDQMLAFTDQLAKDKRTPIDCPEQPGKTTNAQLRALWAKAFAAGWDRERVKSFLDEKFGTHKPDEIVGQVDRKVFSQLIDALSAA